VKKFIFLHKLKFHRYLEINKNLYNDSINALINFLADKVNERDLLKRIKNFKKSTYKERILQLPSIYLQLENHIAITNNFEENDLLNFRRNIPLKFKELKNLKNFRIIFRPIEIQEIILCQNILNQLLKKISSITGNFNQLSKIHEELNKTQNTREWYSNHLKRRKKINQFSLEIFNVLSDSLGKKKVLSLFKEVYKEAFDHYHLLDAFVITLSIIPEELFEIEDIPLPTKKQMYKMLRKQVHSLEQKNSSLTNEIRERKLIRQTLNDSERLKINILEASQEGIILINDQLKIVDLNYRAEKIFGWSIEEAKDKFIIDFIKSDKTQEIFISELFLFQSTGKAKKLDSQMQLTTNTKDKNLIDIEFVIRPVKHKDGILFCAFIKDVTEQNKVKNEILEAKEIAEKLAKTKATFLSNMSHEIRTPLNSILGFTNLLNTKNTIKNKNDLQNIDNIRFSAQNLLAIVNDTLDFSKIEAGKLKIQNTDFNIVEVFHNIVDSFKLKSEEKKILFKSEIDFQIPVFVKGDQYRLNQILLNLLSNAIKFTHKGSVTLKLECIKKTKDSIAINFIVADTGIGIPSNQLNSIFDSFYQVHEPGKDKIEGTGLGLAISKKLIELQKSTLHLKSEVNKGSTFSFTLYFDKSKLVVNTKRKEKKSQNESFPEIKALVAEDNKMNQLYLKQLFKRWGIEIEIAKNGSTAVEMAQEKTYDFVLMDLHMPYMDGFEATQLIKQLENYKNIPIIACSADVFPESRESAKNSGIDYYLTKPIEEKVLLSILQNIYNLKKQLTSKKEKRITQD